MRQTIISSLSVTRRIASIAILGFTVIISACTTNTTPTQASSNSAPAPKCEYRESDIDSSIVHRVRCHDTSPEQNQQAKDDAEQMRNEQQMLNYSRAGKP